MDSSSLPPRMQTARQNQTDPTRRGRMLAFIRTGSADILQLLIPGRATWSNREQIVHKIESAWEFRRRRSAELVMEGESTSTIARCLGVSTQFINKWYKIARAGGSLAYKPVGGRPRKLSSDQLSQLEALLMEGASAHGWNNNLWTSKRVAAVIWRYFGVKFRSNHAWHVLMKYLGWTRQRPVQQLRERDERAIEFWKVHELPVIVNRTRRRRAQLVFIDESGFMLAPTIRQTFAPRGQTPINKVFDPHGRISVIGAIVTTPALKRFRFFYELLPDNANFRSNEVLSFLRRIRNRLAKPMTILWDAIPIHRARSVKRFFGKQKDIVVDWFPPYAPELNPVDKIWFYLKFHLMANFTPIDIAQLRQCLTQELARVRSREDLILSCVRRTKLGLVQNS